MSQAAKSVFVFSLYLFIVGTTLVVVPNLLLGLFRIPETHEVWIRVVGMLALVLGYYYWTAAKGEMTELMRATVLGRFSVLGFFIVFVVLGFAPTMLLVFGVVDAVAAIWTAWALRQESSTA